MIQCLGLEFIRNFNRNHTNFSKKIIIKFHIRLTTNFFMSHCHCLQRKLNYQDSLLTSLMFLKMWEVLYLHSLPQLMQSYGLSPKQTSNLKQFHSCVISNLVMSYLNLTFYRSFHLFLIFFQIDTIRNSTNEVDQFFIRSLIQ